MKTSDFDYELPQEQIAQLPVDRGSSRMLVLRRAPGGTEHSTVLSFPDRLDADDLLLLNDTRVMAARIDARRPTGRRFEILLLERLDETNWEAMLRPSARAREGERLNLADGGAVVPEQRLGDGLWRLSFDPPLDLERVERIGHTPLPPYIRRPEGASPEDREAYQTVYAATPGAVAAPTAGLHFTEQMLEAVRERGVETVFTTLHVGIGTFRPVSVEEIADHRMHEEKFHFGEKQAEAINGALDSGRRIVCVGTTSVRALEGALQSGGGRIRPGWDATEIFITPGYRFRGVGALLTNFHLPRSTLLMLVSALAGRDRVLAAYREAVGEGYRFFSYGDAMLIE